MDLSEMQSDSALGAKWLEKGVPGIPGFFSYLHEQFQSFLKFATNIVARCHRVVQFIVGDAQINFFLPSTILEHKFCRQLRYAIQVKTIFCLQFFSTFLKQILQTQLKHSEADKNIEARRLYK